MSGGLGTPLGATILVNDDVYFDAGRNRHHSRGYLMKQWSPLGEFGRSRLSAMAGIGLESKCGREAPFVGTSAGWP